MKKIISALFLFLACISAFAGQQPIKQNAYTTNDASVLIYPMSNPEIFMFQGTNFYFGGRLYHPTNSATAGIQESLNLILPASSPSTNAGMTLRFAPGVYYTYTNIQPLTSSNPFCLTFEGAGETASGITYVGSITQDVLTVGYPLTSSSTIFNARNMWFSSALDGCTNIVHLRGWGNYGGIANCDIENCWFGGWQGMTNLANAAGPNIFGFTPSIANEASGYAHNLVGLNIECNYNEATKVEHCAFTYCIGLSLSSDHAKLLNNEFEFSGNTPQNPANNWPTSSPYNVGASCYVIDPLDGGLNNGNQALIISGNYFVGTLVAYFFSTTIAGGPTQAASYGDQFEQIPTLLVTGGVYQGSLIGSADFWTFENPKAYASGNSYNCYVLTSVDYSLFKTVNATNWGTNVVRFVDNLNGTNSGNQSFGGYVQSPYFKVSTNYVATRMTPIQGYTTIFGSNNIIWFVNNLTTNHVP